MNKTAINKDLLLLLRLFCYFKGHPKTMNIGHHIIKYREEQDLTRESMAREMEINLSSPSPRSLAASEANQRPQACRDKDEIIPI